MEILITLMTVECPVKVKRSLLHRFDGEDRVVNTAKSAVRYQQGFCTVASDQVDHHRLFVDRDVEPARTLYDQNITDGFDPIDGGVNNRKIDSTCIIGAIGRGRQCKLEGDDIIDREVGCGRIERSHQGMKFCSVQRGFGNPGLYRFYDAYPVPHRSILLKQADGDKGLAYIGVGCGNKDTFCHTKFFWL
jgi:hypothetical protein